MRCPVVHDLCTVRICVSNTPGQLSPSDLVNTAPIGVRHTTTPRCLLAMPCLTAKKNKETESKNRLPAGTDHSNLLNSSSLAKNYRAGRCAGGRPFLNMCRVGGSVAPR